MSNNVRAVDLLRVSTKQQGQLNGNNEIDIPEQKRIVEEYIFNQGWDLVHTLVEGGISAFKNLGCERDAIQEAIEMAKNREYDTLVVYHSNRLGRLADDTPAIIKELGKYGVRVFSISEGEISVKTHLDKAMTFFRYWNNEQESIYKSEIISDYHLAMTREGRFRGGNMLPLGYELVNKGSKNHKGRMIYDFVKNEKEAEIVRLIYDLSINYNYGQIKIAKHLNENNYPTRKGNEWTASTIKNILNNTIYKGQFHMNSKVREKTVYSEPQQELIIISPELWDENQEKLKERKRTTDRKYDYDFIDSRNKISSSTGRMLLNGLAFCGHCGAALTTMTAYQTWQTIDGIKHREAYYKYRCCSFYTGKKSCEGKSTYSATKIEPIVIKETKNFILDMQGRDLEDAYIESVNKKIEDLNQEKNKIIKNIETCNRELVVLKNEVVKILSGQNSNFSQELISELIKNKEKEIDDYQTHIYITTNNINKIKYEKNQLINLKDKMVNWNEVFDKSGLEEKRMMLSEVIDKILVYRDSIEIHFNIKIESYFTKPSMGCVDESLVRVLR